MKTFCDIIIYISYILEWYIETSMFDGPPTCTKPNRFGDSFCPDEAFNDIVNFSLHFNDTLNNWNLFPGTEGMFTCFEDVKNGKQYDFYSVKIKQNAEKKEN